MKLFDIGEEGLIDRILREHLLPTAAPGLVVGVGDDAAVIDLGKDELTVVTTDMLVEGTHFRLDLITPYQLGWKSVAVNISDVAAMGGTPTWSFVSVSFRPDTDVRFVDEMYQGMTECSARYGSTLVGGDTNSVKAESVINICQIGSVNRACVTVRSGARVGDRLLVTGWLGDSRAGLELLLKHGLEEAANICRPLVTAHLLPVPRVAEAGTAAETGVVNAMMDVSDGLGADLPKLCRASAVGAVVYADKLPISEDLWNASEKLETSALDLAAGGGEDFELLMAVPPGDAGPLIGLIEDRTGTRVTEIGEIVHGPVEIAYPDGTRKPLKGGWEHFTHQ